MKVTLDMTDAMELEQLLDFVARWMKFDHDYLAPSLARFLGIEVEGYGPDSLVRDFAKFRFLLGATYGEGVVIPDEQLPRPRAACTPPIDRRVGTGDSQGKANSPTWQRRSPG